MNHRVLFFLSIFIIAIGVVGIVTQSNKSGETDTAPAVTHASTGTHTVIIAEARHDLKPLDILQARDFQISTLTLSEDRQDVRDLSALGDGSLNGYLVRHHIQRGAAILPAMIEAPSSKTFLLHSLKPNELPYGYLVSSQEAYLLTTLTVGSKVSLYIRVAEIEKDKTSHVSLGVDGSASSARSSKKYAISRISGPLSIIDLQTETERADQNISYSNDKPVGKIILRMNKTQLAELRVVEKAGDILLLPASTDGFDNKKIDMDEVLPQFRAIKELRGGK